MSAAPTRNLHGFLGRRQEPGEVPVNRLQSDAPDHRLADRWRVDCASLFPEPIPQCQLNQLAILPPGLPGLRAERVDDLRRQLEADQNFSVWWTANRAGLDFFRC